MKNKLQISITQPCTEKFESFTPTSLGGFCGSCQKEVIDFTHWNEDRIKAYFKSKPLNTCGRFQANQLKVYEYEQSLPLPGWLPKLVMGLLVLLTTRSTIAQTKVNIKSLTEQVDQPQSIIGDTLLVKLSSIKVSGIVKSAEDSTTLPGINIIRKGTSDGTATDANGYFEIEINHPQSDETLVFSFIGLKTLEYQINVHEKDSVINPALSIDVMTLGGAIIVGGITRTRWYSPRTWWWKVRNVFSRY